MILTKNQTFNRALCLSFSEKVVAEKPLDSLVANARDNNRTILRLRAERDNVNFKYNAVFNSSDRYCVILDKHLNIVDYNRASVMLISGIFGKTLTIGQQVNCYLNNNSELKDAVLNSCARALNGETFIKERKVDFGDNKVTWWRAEYSPAFDEDGSIAGIVFNAVDITRLKMRELEIQSQNEKLEAISLMQSHDIRGPLCTMMGLMNLLKDEINSDDYQTYLQLMDVTIALLDKTIRGIVEYANDKHPALLKGEEL